MRWDVKHYAKRIMIFALLCLIAFSLSECTRDAGSPESLVALNDDKHSSYPGVGEQILPAYTASLDAAGLPRQYVAMTRLYSSQDDRRHQYRVLICAIIVVAWLASLMHRIAHKNMRKTVLIAVALMLGWMLARLISYQLDVNTDFRRYLNYTYFFFQLLIPIAFVWLTHMIGKNEGKIPVPWWIKVYAAYMITLILLAFTNDLHHLVLTYDFSNPHWADTEGYGIIYNTIQRSRELSFVAVFIFMLLKSKGCARKRGLPFPLIFIALFIAYQYGYQNGIPIARDSDITMVTGIFVLLLAESMTGAGMIPVNTKYKALFTHTPLSMNIVDPAGNAVLSSAYAEKHDRQVYENSYAPFQSPIQYDENTLLFSKKIDGGYVYWKEDIAGLNRLHIEIEESVRRLQTANMLLAEEEKIKRASQEEQAKTQLMAQLESEITTHTIRLTEMIDQLEGLNDRPKAIARITLLLCYIKRCCYRFFQERESEFLPADELTVYLDELAEMASYSGVKTMVTSTLRAHLPIRQAAVLYDFFYSVIYWASRYESSRILVHLGADSGCVILRLLPSEDARSFKMDEELEKAITTAGGTYVVKDIDEDDVGLSLSFPEGGERGA